MSSTGPRTDSGNEGLAVLNLTPSPESSFYRNQIDALASADVVENTVAVPGTTEGAGSNDTRSPLDYLQFLFEVRREVGDHYDVVHANYGLTAPHGLAQRRLPVVLSLWGTDIYGPFGWLSKACAPWCDAVIVMTEHMGEQLPCDYTVIPHGVDLDRFEPEPQAHAKASLGWDEDGKQVLFPSSINRPEKNYPRAKRIVAAAREELDEPIRLRTLDGAVPYEQMPTVMSASDVLLLTSRHEGSPNVVKEALACNLPVVSTDVGDVDERLAGVTPSAVGATDDELVDALVTILQLGERSNGRQSVRHLSIDRTAERIRRVYERVLADDERGSGEPSGRRRVTRDEPSEKAVPGSWS